MIWNEIRNLLSSESRNILGVMSGTSADGLELAVVSCLGSGKSMKVRLLEHSSVQFESSFHEEIVKTFDPSLSGVDRVNSMNFLIGK
ncbi:MAG: anhydro-N-acetylmuramic acid kinase, partial [Mesotoga sp.]